MMVDFGDHTYVKKFILQLSINPYRPIPGPVPENDVSKISCTRTGPGMCAIPFNRHVLA